MASIHLDYVRLWRARHDGHELAQPLGEGLQHCRLGHAWTENRQPHVGQGRVKLFERGDQIADALDLIPRTAEQETVATWRPRCRVLVEKLLRDPMSHDVDAIGGLPAMVQGELPIAFVEQY